MNKEMMDNSIKDQADAWFEVYDLLSAGNPDISSLADTGLGSALAEIKRLQQAAASKDDAIKAMGSDVAARILQVTVKSVYGNLMVYPVNETAHRFADLLRVKTFDERRRADIKALGYEFVIVSQHGIIL